jgi:hypothetical protein
MIHYSQRLWVDVLIYVSYTYSWMKLVLRMKGLPKRGSKPNPVSKYTFFLFICLLNE